MAKRGISKEEHTRNLAFRISTPHFRSDMSSKDRKTWFDRARSTGLFGKRYQTYDQFERAIKSLGEAGYTPRQVQRLINYQASNAVIERKQGQLRIKSRGIRESNENLVRADMDRVLGPGAADRVEAAQRKAWDEARKETTALTKGQTQRDLGHPQEGLPADPRVAPDENRVDNQKNGREGNATRFFANNAEDFIEITSGADGGYQPRALVHGQVAWAREAERDRPGSLPNRAVASDRAVSESTNLHSLGYGSAQEIAPRARVIQASIDRGYALPQIMEQIKATGSSIPDGKADDAVAQSGPVRQISGPTKSKVSVVKTDGKAEKRLVSTNAAAPTPKSIPVKPSNGNSNLFRIARNTAPMWASLPLGAAVLGQSAHAAVTNPNADTIETAAWDGANLIADGLSLVPIPMVMAGAEAAQKTLGIAQAARQGQKYVQQQNLRPSAPMPRPAAVPQAQSRPRTATVARTRGRTMPTSAPLDPGKLINNFIQSGYKSVFGNRES